MPQLELLILPRTDNILELARQELHLLYVVGVCRLAHKLCTVRIGNVKVFPAGFVGAGDEGAFGRREVQKVNLILERIFVISQNQLLLQFYQLDTAEFVTGQQHLAVLAHLDGRNLIFKSA